MKIKLLLADIILLLTCVATAQDFKTPALPTTKEEFIKSEPDISKAKNQQKAATIGTQKNKTLSKAIDEYENNFFSLIYSDVDNQYGPIQ